jgi:hypothetical protein
LIDDPDFEVVVDAHLAGEAHVFGEAGFYSEAIALGVADFSGVARQHFDAAGRTLGVPSATMQDVYPGVFYRQHQLAPLFGFESLRARSSLSFDPCH